MLFESPILQIRINNFLEKNIDKNETIQRRLSIMTNKFVLFNFLSLLSIILLFLYFIPLISKSYPEFYNLLILFFISLIVLQIIFLILKSYEYKLYFFTNKKIILFENIIKFLLYKKVSIINYNDITDVIKEKDSIQIYVRTKNSFEAKLFVLKTLRHHTEEIYNLIQKNIENKNKE